MVTELTELIKLTKLIKGLMKKRVEKALRTFADSRLPIQDSLFTIHDPSLPTAFSKKFPLTYTVRCHRRWFQW